MKLARGPLDHGMWKGVESIVLSNCFVGGKLPFVKTELIRVYLKTKSIGNIAPTALALKVPSLFTL